MRRQITATAIEHFNTATAFKSGNTEVQVLPNVTVLKLFGNEIAYQYNNPERTLSICDGGYKMSKTTQERLNGLNGVKVMVKGGETYLNGIVWDGKLIDIKATSCKN